MKVCICVSNKVPKISNGFYRLFQKKFNKEFNDWSSKFIEYAEEFKLDYDVVNVDDDNWINRIEKYDVLLWKPQFMGPESSQFFREKIYFIQHIMGKRVYPNYETIWHFDSKFAQKYLFEYQKIKTPDTFASHSYNDAVNRAEKAEYPIVYKLSSGAGGSNVSLVKTSKELIKKINKQFFKNRIINMLLRNSKRENFGSTYMQSFIEGNKSDLRVNIIGDKYGVGFYRKNRENDFRASGSGNINYNKEIPNEILEYCLNISKKNKFDSMAYDILFTEEDFVIVEMSYGYSDVAVYNAKGYYQFNDEGKIEEYNEENIWPQKLWIKWLISDLKLDVT